MDLKAVKDDAWALKRRAWDISEVHLLYHHVDNLIRYIEKLELEQRNEVPSE